MKRQLNGGRTCGAISLSKYLVHFKGKCIETVIESPNDKFLNVIVEKMRKRSINLFLFLKKSFSKLTKSLPQNIKYIY